jgi:hypothetical protein
MDMAKVCKGEGKDCIKPESKQLFMITRDMPAKGHHDWRLLIGDEDEEADVRMEQVSRCKMRHGRFLEPR